MRSCARRTSPSRKTNGLGLRGYLASRITFIGRPRDLRGLRERSFLRRCARITNDHADASYAMVPGRDTIIYTSIRQPEPRHSTSIDLATTNSDIRELQGTNIRRALQPGRQARRGGLTGSGPRKYGERRLGHNPSRLTHTDRVKSSPCWSPDGGRLVFAQEPGPQLYVISAGGGGMQPIAAGFGNFLLRAGWSRADPEKIAFSFMRGGRFQIGVYSLSTGTAEQASKATFDGVEPSWLPDGRHLVYTARNSVTNRICYP